MRSSRNLLEDTVTVQFPQLKGNGIEFSQHFQTVFAVI